MKSPYKHSKLELSHIHSDLLTLYFLRKNLLIKFMVKTNAFFVKKRKIRILKANFYIVDFVVILHAKYVAVSKENSNLLLKQDYHSSKYQVCVAKFAIENFLKNL